MDDLRSKKSASITNSPKTKEKDSRVNWSQKKLEKNTWEKRHFKF